MRCARRLRRLSVRCARERLARCRVCALGFACRFAALLLSLGFLLDKLVSASHRSLYRGGGLVWARRRARAGPLTLCSSARRFSFSCRASRLTRSRCGRQARAGLAGTSEQHRLMMRPACAVPSGAAPSSSSAAVAARQPRTACLRGSTRHASSLGNPDQESRPHGALEVRQAE